MRPRLRTTRAIIAASALALAAVAVALVAKAPHPSEKPVPARTGAVLTAASVSATAVPAAGGGGAPAAEDPGPRPADRGRVKPLRKAGIPGGPAPESLERPRALERVAVRGASATRLRSLAGRLGLRVVREVPQLRLVVVEPTSSKTTGRELANAIEAAGVGESVQHAVPMYPAIRPSDTYFGYQWGYENTGQSGGTVGADSKATSAWDWSRGTGTVVAVIDTGADFSVADLASKAWSNPGEIAGNGLDDDLNGFIDDVNGWDFLNDDGTVFDLGDGDQHGTHVAGTVGARTNDAAGVAGMGWDTRIMSLKFLGQHQGSDIDAAAAIVYAVDEGADVINASWGGPSPSTLIEDAIAYAAARDVLFVCAAGNNGQNIDSTPFYPASLPATNIVSVAALDRNNGLASFSNRGATGVDLGAPGVSVLSTVPRWTAGLLVDDAPAKAVYLPFQAESITNSTARQEVIARAMAQLATSTASSVLVVDDAWQSLTTAYETAGWRRSTYLSALSTIGYSNVTTWSTEVSGTPPASAMSGKTVVWFTGASTFAIPSVWPLIETHGTLTTAERTEVGTFLDGGGRLLISSGDLAYEMMYLAATKGTLTWFRNYLHARYLSDDPGVYSVVGRSGTIYNGMSWVTDDPLRYSDGFDDIGPYDSSASAVALWPHDFMYMDGTSMASPHVAGTVALMKARVPTLTAEAIKTRLLSTADPVASLGGLSVSGGRLDAAEAVGTLDAPTALRAWAGGSDRLQVAWTNPSTPDFASTRLLARIGVDPTGPTDASATVVYEGSGTTATHAGLTVGDEVHYAIFARSSLGGWSSPSRLTTTFADPGPGVAIPAGTGVSVTHEGVTLTFPSVRAPGWLSVTRMPPRQTPPAGVRWLPDGYYEIHPIGDFETPVDIGLPFSAASVEGSETAVKLYHDTGGGSWEDATLAVDTGANTLTARVDSFSEFGLGEPAGAGAGGTGVDVEASAVAPVPATVAVLLLAATGALAANRRRADISHWDA